MDQEKPKVKYRIGNWPEYNQALINRGSLTIWFDESSLDCWFASKKPEGPGHPLVYSNVAIESLVVLKTVYHLPLRQTQGFFHSILGLLNIDLAVPDYSTISRRQKDLSVALPRRQKDEPLHVVIDASGLKVYGEGEWKVRQHGVSKQRTWRKIHIGFDETTKEIVACETTYKDRHDKEELPGLLDQIPEEEEISKVGGDGGYDYQTVYKAILDRGGQAVIPPRKNAQIWYFGPMQDRNHAIERIEEIGRKGWKQESGYHRRSIAENGFYRFKKIFGERLSARMMPNQKVEVRIKCAVLNRMAHLGMPDSYPVAA